MRRIPHGAINSLHAKRKETAMRGSTRRKEYNVLRGTLRDRQRMGSLADRQRKQDSEEWDKALLAQEADLGRSSCFQCSMVARE
ncbi:hypothetical protein KIN20_010896 [Parelaphostrongylus tenuis]|uniref:Uncharacterized protein n=1 Tax=Parelaphostrongylus tenuis TaxID=148309 RepID=A0AAD5MSQ5_PARTN|nr:hypothetical protein KIN20_010896 [Parelaphostrongylus tenuis]